MFLDASVIVAILGREPGHEEIVKQLSASRSRFFVSPLVRFEASVSLARQKATRRRPTASMSAEMLRQARAAVDAFIASGRIHGRKRKARNERLDGSQGRERRQGIEREDNGGNKNSDPEKEMENERTRGHRWIRT